MSKPMDTGPHDPERSVGLLQLAQAGDEQARTDLLGRYLPRLERWASRRLPLGVRTMLDSNAKTLKAATPGTPVELFGLDEVPDAGDAFHVVADERLARAAVAEQQQAQREGSQFQRPQATLESLFKESAEEKSEKTLNLILKADVRGSLEPLKNELEKLEHKEVQLNLLYASLGAVTQSDVDAAIASNAVIIGFHVLSEPAARKSAERGKVQIRHYNVI